MIVYIQKQNGEWLNENCYAAMYGFTRMGRTVKSFEADDVDFLRFADDVVVFGGVNALNHILTINNVAIPKVPNIITDMPNVCSRKMSVSTLGEVRKGNIEYPFFVKPLVDYKLFSGFVCKVPYDLHKIPNLYRDETEVLLSEVVNIISEYRCFVFNNELVGCKNYTGDFKILPDFNYINMCISKYKGPTAYTMDFGQITYRDRNITELIEINDGYAFGGYGFNPIIYCRMIEARWKEIFKNKL